VQIVKGNGMQPCLIRTCHSLRTEATLLYFTDTQSHYIVHDWEGLVSVLFHKLLLQYRKPAATSKCEIELCGTPHRCGPDNTRGSTLARRMYGVVDSMHGLCWQRVTNVLEPFWEAIDMFDDMDAEMRYEIKGESDIGFEGEEIHFEDEGGDDHDHDDDEDGASADEAENDDSD
jgi:hypothetical protein